MTPEQYNTARGITEEIISIQKTIKNLGEIKSCHEKGKPLALIGHRHYEGIEVPEELADTILLMVEAHLNKQEKALHQKFAEV